MTEAIKKCQDCKLSTPSENSGAGKWDFARCCHPASVKESNEKWHLGETSIAYHYCSTMRSDKCGKAATLFEPLDQRQSSEGII